MPPVSNVMPLPISPSTGCFGSALRFVPQHDHARRFRTAPRHAEEKTHLEVGDALFVEYLNRQSGIFGNDRRTVGKGARCEFVAWFVCQLARQIRVLAEYPAAFEPAAHRSLVAVHAQQHRLEPHEWWIDRLVGSTLEVGKNCPLREYLDCLMRSRVQARSMRDRDARQPALASGQRPGRRSTAQAIG